MSSPDPRGATALGNNKKSGGWWKWLLALILLLLVIAAIILIASSGDDDDDKTATATTPGVATQTTGAASTAETTATSSTEPGGTLDADGQSLLGQTSIKNFDGQDATGKALMVLAVEDSGFFVGTAATDQVFVEYGSDVGVNEEAAAYTPKVGDTVNLTGPVAQAPKDPEKTLNVDATTAKAVTKLGGYINADTVEKTS